MTISGLGTGPGVSGAIRTFESNSAAAMQSMMRLATGSRINRGADDPAGLIASESLRADLASIEGERRALERQDAIAGAADGAMEEYTSLVADARALEVANANTGALSDAERQANQMEIDSEIAGANRIADTASFNGQKLLDGSVTLRVGADSFSITAPRVGSGNVGEALDAATDLRGQLGSFQKYAIEARIGAGQSAYQSTAAANSAIRDTDFASEAADLARTRALEQASLIVLAIGTRNSGAILDTLA